MNEKIRYWIDLAEYDLKTAKVLLKGGAYLYVGFMCHQSIEKTLKALFISRKNAFPPYTHNLAYLAKQSDAYDTLSDKQKDFIDLVEPFHIEARYPKEKERILQSLTKARCASVIHATEDLLEWIKKQL
jgi:HEPN domain-containing protein